MFTAPTRSQIGARVRFGDGLPRGGVFGNNNPFRGPRRLRVPLLSPFPGFGVLSLPFQTYNDSVEGQALATELDQLFAYSAGLEASWRELEEDARRAGASPGWLRQ